MFYCWQEISCFHTVCQSLLSRSSLSENQTLRLDALYTLCHLCSHESNSRDKNEVDTKYIKSKIIKLLDDELFDPRRYIDIQMVKYLLYHDYSKVGKTYYFWNYSVNLVQHMTQLGSDCWIVLFYWSKTLVTLICLSDNFTEDISPKDICLLHLIIKLCYKEGRC